MGCDIHVMCERKYNGVWLNCDHFMVNQYSVDDPEEDKYRVVPIYDDRNYDLFAFLADVRNYGDVKPFGFDRGIPEDAHDATRREFESWGMDAHTPGYCTLDELKKKAKETRTITRKGYVPKEVAAEYRETGKVPEFWCQWTNMDWVYLEWEDETHCIDGILEAMQKRKNEIFRFYEDEHLGEKDKEFRIIFWFDN